CVPQQCTPGQLACSADATQVLKCDPGGQSQLMYQTCSDPQSRGNRCVNGVCVDRCALAEAGPRTTLGCRFVAAAYQGGLLVANPQPDYPVTVTVSAPNGPTVTHSVPAASSLTVFAQMAAAPAPGSSASGSGWIVTSSMPIYAWQLSQPGGDGSALLP